MSLIKYQYFVLDEASIIRFEIRVEYMWEEVLKPTAIYKFRWLILLSIDEGTQTMFVLTFWLMK
jgi:hypothetical protein